MRIARVLYRMKRRPPGPHLSVKVVTNCRIRTKKNPVQIHLGYLSLMFDGKIPPGQRSKLLRNLRKGWSLYFKDEDVDIDWDDAERKWEQLRASAGISGIMAASTRPALEKARRNDDPRDEDHHSGATLAAPGADADHERSGAGVNASHGWTVFALGRKR